MQLKWLEWVRNLFTNHKINPLNEREYRILLENIPVITYINALDEPNNTLYISPQAEKLLGYPRAAFLTDPILWIKLMHPDDKEQVIRESERTNHTLEPFSQEYRLIAKDGRSVWMHDDAVVVRDAAGHPQYWLGVWTDISERKQAENDAHHLEDLYRRAIQSADAVPYYRDYRQGGYSFMGEGILQMTGYSAAEITPEIFEGIVVEHLLRGSLAPYSYEEANRLTEDGIIRHWECDYRISTRAGETRWLADSCVQVRNENDVRVGVIGILQDITERKKSEASLRESEERYRSFISQSTEGIRRYDLDEPIPVDLPEDEQLARMLKHMYVAECNDAFARMYGLASAAELVGKYLGEMGLEKDPQNLQALRGFIRSRYKVLDVESHEVDARGQEKFFLINTIGLVEDGCLRRVWGTQRDITERKKSELVLRQRETMLEALTFVAERFLSVSDWRQNIDLLLERLGRSISASHAYVFEHHTENAARLKSLRYEWIAPGQSADIGKAIYQGVPVRNPNFEVSYRLLSNGQPLIADRAHLTPEEHAFLLARDLKALLEMPIFVDNIWWGTIGFDDYVIEREWSIAEVDLLKVAANIISAAIQRNQAEVSLRTRETILAAMTFAAERFLSVPDWRRNIDVVLERLGQGLNASHVYIFEHRTVGHERRSSLRYEWTAAGQSPDLGKPNYQNMPVGNSDGDFSYDVLKSGQTFLGDRLHLRDADWNELHERGLKAVLETPIVVEELWWGTIGLDDCVNDRIWTSSEVDLLKVAASTISAAIQRTQADEEIYGFNAALEQRIADLNAINQISHTLMIERDLRALIQTVGEQIRATFNASVVYIALLNSETNLIDFYYQYWNGKFVQGAQIKYGEGMTSRIMQLRRPVLINSNWEQEATSYGAISDGEPAKASLIVPLLIGDEAIGTISLQDMQRENLYTDDHVRQLTTIAANLAVAIENARLHTTLEQRVKERTELLETANRELETFSYSVSHDLRAPLRAIQSFSNLLVRDHGAVLNAEGRSFLERVIQAASEMNEKIEGLLAFARLTRAGLRPVELDLSAMATRVLEVLHAAQPERNVTIHIAPGLVARGDEVLIRTVLENLLGNAWKYSTKTLQPVIEFGALLPENQVVFFVRDNGAGFNMKYADKLFGAFQRLHRVDEFPGHGIGLATVQRIIHRHGGRIWAEAEEGQGATFYFTLG